MKIGFPRKFAAGVFTHCWQGPVTPAQRVVEIAQHIQRHKPEGADTPWWNY